MTQDNQRHVVICEDEPDIRELIRDILELDGYQIDVFKDGGDQPRARIKKLIESGQSLVVVSDLGMPPGNQGGLELFNAARSMGLDPNRFLLLTAMSSSHVPQDFPGRFVAKPFQLNALKKEVQQAFEGGRPRPADLAGPGRGVRR